jgi:hypothetical protein
VWTLTGKCIGLLASTKPPAVSMMTTFNTFCPFCWPNQHSLSTRFRSTYGQNKTFGSQSQPSCMYLTALGGPRRGYQEKQQSTTTSSIVHGKLNMAVYQCTTSCGLTSQGLRTTTISDTMGDHHWALPPYTQSNLVVTFVSPCFLHSHVKGLLLQPFAY